MTMPPAARITLLAGLLGLGGAMLNQVLTPELTPSFQRAEALAALMGVGLLLVAILWTRAMPAAPERADLQGEQGLRLSDRLDPNRAADLGWGSLMLLTATPAATVLVYWDGAILLQRGLLPERSGFQPGPICRQVSERGRAISLVNLALYPGRVEFEAVLPGLPSVVVEPLGERGWLVVGGWSPRCFSRSDEAWIQGLGQRLTAQLLTSCAANPGIGAES